MKCSGCKYYKSGFMWNCCELTESEYFHTLEDCTLVNNDQTVNEEEMTRIFRESIKL